MNKSMKPRIDFSEMPAEQCQAELKTAIEFEPSDASAFIPDPATDETEQAEIQEISEIPIVTHLGGEPGLWRKMVTVGLVILGLSAIAQGGEWVYQAWQDHDWISFGAAMACGFIIIAGAGALISDWRNFYKLRERAQERDEGHRLLHSHSMGRGRTFCEKLARQAGLDNQHPAMQRWLAACHETHNDREVVMLYAQLVQSAIDQSVRREISRSAAEAALMVAVSPLAIVDMAFIAWRNLRLVKRIAAMYGIQPGYWGRIRLFRLVLFNMAFAGVTELIREAGMDWISQDVAARFSARAAQGIGVGLLTARLGIKTMELCRPLPWLVNDRPRLGDFRNQLVAQLKETVAGKKTPGSDKRH